MTGVILKLSYNAIGDSNLTGGICGSFFFINSNTALTANHVLNKKQFKPNPGYKMCQFWLIIQPLTIIEIKETNLIDHPEIDTTIFKLEKSYPVKTRNLSSKEAVVGSACFNEGFVAEQMPKLDIKWKSGKLVISSCNYENNIANGKGTIKSIQTLSQNAPDVKIKDVKGIETSYRGVIGMSGGPLIDKESDEILGLMSIGLPPDLKEKTSLFAISVDEILKKI